MDDWAHVDTVGRSCKAMPAGLGWAKTHVDLPVSYSCTAVSSLLIIHGIHVDIVYICGVDQKTTSGLFRMPRPISMK